MSHHQIVCLFGTEPWNAMNIVMLQKGAEKKDTRKGRVRSVCC